MHVLYWIHTKIETDPYTQGYIGVSNNFNERLKSHKTGYGNKNVYDLLNDYSDVVVIEFLHFGEESEIYDMELKYRPYKNIGLNIAEGGYKPPSALGNKERAKKAANSLKGRKITWGDKISESRKGKKNSPEAIAKGVATRKANGVVAWNKGIKTGPQSPELIEKRSNAMKGKNARKVKTPLGIFDSITEAAKAHEAKIATIHARISKYKMDGYEYV